MRKTEFQPLIPVAVPTQSYIERLHAKAPPNVIEASSSMNYGNQSKYITAKFDPKKFPNGIEILHLTDVQYGHMYCDVAKFIEYRDWVLKEPNRFVFFGGDMVDSATVISVASPYENTTGPDNQVYEFCELAMPLRHRVLGYVGGNHERRGVKTFGDLGPLIAMLLKIPFSGGKQFVDIHYGKHAPFKNSLWHGGTGSRTKGAKAQMLHRFMTQGDSQVYWVGHLHDVLYLGDVRERRDPAGGAIKPEKFCGVMSSSFLGHYGTYAETMGMSVGDCQMWRLTLTPDGHWGMNVR